MKNLKKIHFVYASIAALVYSATAGIFIHFQSYFQSWLLYMGNALFGIVIAFFIFRYYKRSDYKLKVTQLIVAGQMTSIIGIVISCVICLLLLWILVPDFYFHAPDSENVLRNPPTQLEQGKNSYLLVLLMDTVIGNIGTGAFIAVLLPFTLLRNQKDQ